MSCNVVFQYIDFSKKNIDKSFKLIMGKYYDKDIVYMFLDKYISVRYFYDSFNYKTKLYIRLNNELESVYEKCSLDKNVSKFVLEIFKIIYYFDDVIYIEDKKGLINNLNKIRVDKLGLVDKDFVTKFTLLWKDNDKRKTDYINKFDCFSFPVKLKKIFNSDIYDVSIGYNLDIPKLYSQYAIDKVFNTGIIALDKLFIEYYMVSSFILKRVIKGEVLKNYLVDFNVELFFKKGKIQRLFNIIDNDVCRDVISLKIRYEDFLEFKDSVYDLMRDGYKFSVFISDDVSFDNNLLDIFEYILLDKNSSLVYRLDKYNNVILIK